MADLVAKDPEVRAARTTAEDLAQIRDGRSSSTQLVEAACARFGERPCLGMRAKDGAGALESLSFAELWTRVVAAATGLQDLARIGAGDLVGIAGFASTDWIVSDLACAYLGAVSVPLQGGEGDLDHILRETGLACIFASAEKLDLVRRLAERHPALQSVIVIDRAGWSGKLPAVANVHTILGLEDVETRGREVGPAGMVVPRPEQDPLLSIVYTSGSTGAPKGVMITERRWSRTLRDALEGKPMPSITVGYLPLSHMAGRISVYTTMMSGGRTDFVTRSDMSSLFDDIRRTRPTSMTLVPRVSAMVYQHFQTELLKRGGRLGTPAAMLEDPLAAPLMREIREHLFGGRLCFATTGAAPTAPEVAAFLERCFEIHLVDTYGSTEFGRVTVNGRVQPWIQYKLVDVPELGYTSGDKPFPRGELAVKSPREAPGYYKNEEASTRLRDAQGYILSGDIVEERAPGHIVWIDRKHSVLRLAQGEFVNVSRVEATFTAGSPLIEQIFIYGNSLRAYLLAVVVPNEAAVDAALAQRGGDQDQTREQLLARLIRDEMDRVSAGAQLAGHEVPRAFIVEPRAFSKENELLTEANKPRRPRLREAYGARLEELYVEIETCQLRSLETFNAASTSTLDKLRGVVALTLGLDSGDRLSPTSTFVRLGGDSFAAVRLARLLSEHCGASLPVATLLDPSATLETLARRLESSGRVETSFERVHGRGAEWAHAKDLRLDRFLPSPILEQAHGLPLARGSRVLLTGANGFLGRFLLVELLAQGAEVVCLVRAPNEKVARERVRAPLAKTAALARRFDDASANGRLTVVAGDLSADGLGLEETLFHELADHVDAILHNGALVNHALSYPDLFEPNVKGTAEVIRFALMGRRKPIHFVSTGGIGMGIHRRPILESERAAELWSRRPVAAGRSDYALGYATSKWSCEILLRELHDRYGIPVGISRCGMILPHPAFAEQINEGDAFARLVFGVLRTGLAPTSFYEEGYEGHRHYDGLPVDIVARFIAAATVEQAEGFRTYHVSNSNWDDGVSLDTFVDQASLAGVTLDRSPYATWFGRFRDALERLPEAERARSPFPILERWREPIRTAGGVRLDTSCFGENLKRGAGLDRIPSLDTAYIRHCLRAIANF